MVDTRVSISRPPPSRVEAKARLRAILAERPDLNARLRGLRDIGQRVRPSEIHLTKACNIRCRGCWYFEGGFDTAVENAGDSRRLAALVDQLASDGVTQATLIGGEPTLVLDRVQAVVERLPYVTVSTNGLRPFPSAGFENVAVAISLFGGGPLDDDLRGHRPNGKSFTGLFDTALRNYRDDPRVIFVFALSEAGVKFIEPTVRAIEDNGNLVTFNFYSEHGTPQPIRIDNERRVLDVALDVHDRFPSTVVSHPVFIETLITGWAPWGAPFGYDVCPSISVDHPAHAERLLNGNPVLEDFAVYGADFETLQFCCTSGDCGGCRDSQAVYSWLMFNMNRFLADAEALETWIALADTYWRQWHWSRLHALSFAAR